MSLFSHSQQSNLLRDASFGATLLAGLLLPATRGNAADPAAPQGPILIAANGEQPVKEKYQGKVVSPNTSEERLKIIAAIDATISACDTPEKHFASMAAIKPLVLDYVASANVAADMTFPELDKASNMAISRLNTYTFKFEERPAECGEFIGENVLLLHEAVINAARKMPAGDAKVECKKHQLAESAASDLLWTGCMPSTTWEQAAKIFERAMLPETVLNSPSELIARLHITHSSENVFRLVVLHHRDQIAKLFPTAVKEACDAPTGQNFAAIDRLFALESALQCVTRADKESNLSEPDTKILADWYRDSICAVIGKQSIPLGAALYDYYLTSNSEHTSSAARDSLQAHRWSFVFGEYLRGNPQGSLIVLKDIDTALRTETRESRKLGLYQLAILAGPWLADIPVQSQPKSEPVFTLTDLVRSRLRVEDSSSALAEGLGPLLAESTLGTLLVRDMNANTPEAAAVIARRRQALAAFQNGGVPNKDMPESLQVLNSVLQEANGTNWCQAARNPKLNSMERLEAVVRSRRNAFVTACGAARILKMTELTSENMATSEWEDTKMRSVLRTGSLQHDVAAEILANEDYCALVLETSKVGQRLFKDLSKMSAMDANEGGIAQDAVLLLQSASEAGPDLQRSLTNKREMLQALSQVLMTSRDPDSSSVFYETYKNTRAYLYSQVYGVDLDIELKNPQFRPDDKLDMLAWRAEVNRQKSEFCELMIRLWGESAEKRPLLEHRELTEARMKKALVGEGTRIAGEDPIIRSLDPHNQQLELIAELYRTEPAGFIKRVKELRDEARRESETVALELTSYTGRARP